MVDEQVGRHDGVRPVEQGEGDSFVAAFARARDAVACALAIQRALAGGPLRLRIGVHAGDVLRRDEGNYVGPAINRAARIRNVAHGGQTVLSQATAELTADDLPEGAWLVDLGVHRLKDLSRPERIFQLCHPDLPAEFPPLRSLDARAHNLPVQRTSFVGRQAEMDEREGLLGRRSRWSPWSAPGAAARPAWPSRPRPRSSTSIPMGCGWPIWPRWPTPTRWPRRSARSSPSRRGRA